MKLARGYIDAAVISPRMLADAQHIAIATVARVTVLVCWNFKHMVNLERSHGYNSVNLRQGYPMIEIRTPREVLLMSRVKKKFDSVKLMRSACDRISSQIEGMTLEEELLWLASQPIEDPSLRRLRDIALQRARESDAQTARER